MQKLTFLLCAAVLLFVVAKAQQEPECPNCTFTIGHHRNNPTANHNLLLCGHTYGDILDPQCASVNNVSPQWCNVARQYVGVHLNLLNGNCTVESLDFDPELLELFEQTPTVLCLNETGKLAFVDTEGRTAAFTAYNEGVFPGGPCHCGILCDNGNGNGNDTEPEDPECRFVCKCDPVVPGNGNETCDPFCEGFCTLTQGNRKNKPENWPVGFNPVICNQMYECLWANPLNAPMGSVWLQLVHQYMAAALTIFEDFNGTCVPQHVLDAFDVGTFQLTHNCSGATLVCDEDQIRALVVQNETIALQAAAILDSFLNGFEGVEHCPGDQGSGNETNCEENGNGNGGEHVCENCEPVLDCCPLPPPPPPQNGLGCTLTRGFWGREKNLPFWPLNPNTTLCNNVTYFETFQGGQGQNFWYVLSPQYIAALNNEANGAFVPEPTALCIAKACDLLKQTCDVIGPQHEQKDNASALTECLSAYNEGDAGVPHCGDEEHQNQTCPHVPPQCPPEPPPQVCTGGCTFTQGKYKNNLGVWPEELIGMTLCGVDWLEILLTPPKKGNASIILAHQIITALINVGNGACLPDGADVLLQLGHDILYACDETQYDKKLNPETRALAIQIAAFFAQYNEGLVGPGHCDIVEGEFFGGGNKRRRSLSSLANSEEQLDALVSQEQFDSGVIQTTVETEVEIHYVTDPAVSSGLVRIEQAVGRLSTNYVTDPVVGPGLVRIEQAVGRLSTAVNHDQFEHSTAASLQELLNTIQLLRNEVEDAHRRYRCPDCKCNNSLLERLIIAVLSIVSFVALILLLWIFVSLVMWLFFRKSKSV